MFVGGGGEDPEGEEVEEESDDGDEEGLEYDYNEAESSPRFDAQSLLLKKQKKSTDHCNLFGFKFKRF